MTNKPKRTFIHFNRAWYAAANRIAFPNYWPIDDIAISVAGGGGEVHIEWINMNHQHEARLHAFDDSWATLAHMTDVIAALAQYDNQNPQPLTICRMLKELGFEDATEEINPHTAELSYEDRVRLSGGIITSIGQAAASDEE